MLKSNNKIEIETKRANIICSYPKKESIFKMIKKQYDTTMLDKQKTKWKNKEQIVSSLAECNLENQNVYNKVYREMKSLNDPIEIDREKIISKFMKVKNLKKKLH